MNTQEQNPQEQPLIMVTSIDVERIEAVVNKGMTIQLHTDVASAMTGSVFMANNDFNEYNSKVRTLSAEEKSTLTWFIRGLSNAVMICMTADLLGDAPETEHLVIGFAVPPRKDTDKRPHKISISLTHEQVVDLYCISEKLKTDKIIGDTYFPNVLAPAFREYFLPKVSK